MADIGQLCVCVLEETGSEERLSRARVKAIARCEIPTGQFGENDKNQKKEFTVCQSISSDFKMLGDLWARTSCGVYFRPLPGGNAFRPVPTSSTCGLGLQADLQASEQL